MSGTIVEELGFEAGDRVAVVHVDDIGMCHAARPSHGSGAAACRASSEVSRLGGPAAVWGEVDDRSTTL